MPLSGAGAVPTGLGALREAGGAPESHAGAP